MDQSQLNAETPARTGRTGTPSRWQAALIRAIKSGIRVYRVASTGEAVVTSQREPDTVYSTDGATCDCAAAMLGGDPVCAHRAAYWHQLGALNVETDSEPPLLASHTERTAAIAELLRLESLYDRGRIKSTADWQRLQSARRHVDAFENNSSSISYAQSIAGEPLAA